MRCSLVSRSYRAAVCVLLAAIALGTPDASGAQDRGSARLQQLVSGLTVTPRVLIVGAHPDDDDPQLIAWLARGHNVETGYFSLTRGEGGDDFIGPESGTSLGAIRTQESIAARKIDGGISFFGRAFDFGITKSAKSAFATWPQAAVVADMVRLIRSFRPHVIVVAFGDTVSDGNGQHEAIGILSRAAFDVASDSLRFPSSVFGTPWTPLKLYQRGAGLSIDASEFNVILGKTYVDIALESRAQHRSQGLFGLTAPQRRGASTVRLIRIASHVDDTTPPAMERSIFDGVDTTFARLADSTHAPPDVARLIPAIASYADSARRAFDVARPTVIVGYLARVVQLATSARAATPWCKHPATDAAPPVVATRECDTRWLDLDASIDLIRRRAVDALLAAAQITVDATSDHELMAESDTLSVAINIANHGAVPVAISDVSVSGAVYRFQDSLTIQPDSARRFTAVVAALAENRPWWIGPRRNELFEPLSVSVDGLHRTSEIMLAPLIVPGVSVPEELHRTSDVSVTFTLAGVTVTTSVGPIIYRSAEPQLGLQNRPVGAAPAVTLAFERGLEWFAASKPIDRQLRLSLKSFSDFSQTFALKIVAPPGVRVDALPGPITLKPREQRELFLHLRGTLPAGRHEFGVVGQTISGTRYLEGFFALRYAHIAPVNFYHSSALYLQAVEIEVPSRLVMAYVPGVRDDLDAMLRQLGVPGVAVNAEDLLSADLSKFTTLVIGPRAYEAHPELAAQNERLLDFVRKGGTMVVLGGQYATTQAGVLAFPAVLSRPAPEHVTSVEAPVTVLDSTSRLLKWPNIIYPLDWKDWVRQRALFVPTAVDSHYAHLIEVHDPGEKENRNALLVSPLGKGTYIYSTLTFFEQLPGGVPGSARLLVNLLSAGCRPKAVAGC